jgi:redox-sensitive bicupin YhaK (pirin superfamily)
MPNKQGVNPRYGQKTFSELERKNKLQTLVSSIDEDFEGSLKIHQDAIISRIDLDKDNTFEYQVKNENHGVYVMTIHGNILINDNNLETRDAVGISETSVFEIMANEDSGLLFIEVPMNI